MRRGNVSNEIVGSHISSGKQNAAYQPSEPGGGSYHNPATRSWRFQGECKMRFCDLRVFLATIAVGLIIPLVASAQSNTSSQSSSLPGAAHALRISPGDLLELGVFDAPDLSGKLRVNDKGEIAIPIAGDIRVAGMTAEEAAVAVEEKLRKADILKFPHVSIFMAEYATQGITVTGEVKNPGIYPSLGNHGIVDMISAAGGVSASAGKAVTVTHRSDPGHPEVVLLDNHPGSVAPNIDIRPGDTITVSRSGVVYVVGDVGKSGGYLIDANERLTAVQALALAGGANRTAAENKARLIRKTPTSRVDFSVPLRRILDGKMIDPQLEDGDILFVPGSKAKTAVTRSMEAAIALTTGVIISGRL